MQNHLSDWYKIKDLGNGPDESLFEKRGLAVASIKELIVDSDDWNPLISSITGIASGFELLGEGNVFIQDLIKCFKDHLLSFPSHLADNGLELRIACGAVIEELITGDLEEENEEADISTLASLLLLSAVGLVPPPTEKYFADNFLRLKSTAEIFLEKQARGIRERHSIDYSPIKNISNPPDASTWLGFRDSLLELLQDIDRNSAADKEELEILWWLQNGYSKTCKQPFADLSPISAAIFAGLETCEIVLIPPVASTIAVVRKAVDINRPKQGSPQKAFSDWVSKKDLNSWSFLSQAESEIQIYISTFPSVFPLSWLGLRMKDSRGAIDWVNEFNQRTGISTERSITSADIAEQVFHEQIVIKWLVDEMRG